MPRNPAHNPLQFARICQESNRLVHPIRRARGTDITMMRANTLGPLTIATLLACAATARAEQFVVTDVSYTHSGETTSDSHYHVDPAAGTPSNWQSPINYGTGSAHVRLEVKTKPGATPTKFQICFESTPGYACTNQSPTYTTTGTYEWTTPFSAFYLGEGGVNWNEGVDKVALILKDTMNNKPQGNPMYVPTDLRVVVTIISPGASFVPPMLDAGAGQDAGSARDAGTDAGSARPIGDAGRDAGLDGGTPDAGQRDAGGSSTTAEAGSAPAQGESDSGSGGSGDPAPGTTGGGTDAGRDAGENDADEGEDEGDGGCSVAPGAQSGSSVAWLALATGLGLVLARRRRRTSPATARVPRQ
jgi:MYXO-CTERM domain-containing protein